MCLLIIYFFHIHENIQAGTSQVGTSQARTSQAGTSQAGTSQAGTSQARTSQAGTSQAGTSQAGTSQAGTSQARTSQVGTSQQGMSQPETSQNLPNSTWPSPNFAINEDRRLFGYTGKGKGKQLKKEKSMNKRTVPMCTLKFVCLPSCCAEKPPTSVRERTALANAGLGDATITFNLDGDSMHLHEQLLKKFPKLSSAGYELMLYHRAGENSSFCILKPPYLPRKLKEVVGQCKIYVKPLQEDLIHSDDDSEGDIQVSCTV